MIASYYFIISRLASNAFFLTPRLNLFHEVVKLFDISLKLGRTR